MWIYAQYTQANVKKKTEELLQDYTIATFEEYNTHAHSVRSELLICVANPISSLSSQLHWKYEVVIVYKHNVKFSVVFPFDGS